MPATAGRVRMPHDNRMSVSASLKTTGIWANTIGHDPYSGGADAAAAAEGEDQEKVQRARELVKQQNVQDGVARDAESNDFALKLYHGLKSSKKKRQSDDSDEEIKQLKQAEHQKMLQILREETSSSEEEEVEDDDRKRARPADGRKKESKRSTKKRKRRSDTESSDSDDDSSSSSSSSSSYERRRRRRRRRKEEKRRRRRESRKKKHKKHRRRRAEGDEGDQRSGEERGHSNFDGGDRQRRRDRRKEKDERKGRDSHDANQQRPDFSAAASFQGSREGYVFQQGPKGLGYYLDKPTHLQSRRRR